MHQDSPGVQEGKQTSFLKKLIGWIFGSKAELEVIEPVKPEPLPEEEKMDRAIAAARERIRPISREHSRPSPTSTLRYSGQSVPSQTHGRPMGSFTGPGMRKLRRHKATRVHEKQMGVDHSLSMDDIEPKRRRRRH